MCHKGFEPLTLRLKVECSTTELVALIEDILFRSPSIVFACHGDYKKECITISAIVILYGSLQLAEAGTRQRSGTFGYTNTTLKYLQDLFLVLQAITLGISSWTLISFFNVTK